MLQTRPFAGTANIPRTFLQRYLKELLQLVWLRGQPAGCQAIAGNKLHKVTGGKHLKIPPIAGKMRKVTQAQVNSQRLEFFGIADKAPGIGDK